MNFFPVFGGVELEVRSRTVLDRQSTHSARSIEHSHHSIWSPRCSLLICPSFKVSLRHALQDGATELVVVNKYLLSESPSWFIARTDIDLQFSFC